MAMNVNVPLRAEVNQPAAGYGYQGGDFEHSSRQPGDFAKPPTSALSQRDYSDGYLTYDYPCYDRDSRRLPYDFRSARPVGTQASVEVYDSTSPTSNSCDASLDPYVMIKWKGGTRREPVFFDIYPISDGIDELKAEEGFKRTDIVLRADAPARVRVVIDGPTRRLIFEGDTIPGSNGLSWAKGSTYIYQLYERGSWVDVYEPRRIDNQPVAFSYDNVTPGMISFGVLPRDASSGALSIDFVHGGEGVSGAMNLDGLFGSVYQRQPDVFTLDGNDLRSLNQQYERSLSLAVLSGDVEIAYLGQMLYGAALEERGAIEAATSSPFMAVLAMFGKTYADYQKYLDATVLAVSARHGGNESLRTYRRAYLSELKRRARAARRRMR